MAASSCRMIELSEFGCGLTRFSLPSARPYAIGLQGPGSQDSLRPSNGAREMQVVKTIRFPPLEAQEAQLARRKGVARAPELSARSERVRELEGAGAKGLWGGGASPDQAL